MPREMNEDNLAMYWILGYYCDCGARVCRVNGVAGKIEGTPDSMMGGMGGPRI